MHHESTQKSSEIIPNVSLLAWPENFRLPELESCKQNNNNSLFLGYVIGWHLHPFMNNSNKSAIVVIGVIPRHILIFNEDQTPVTSEIDILSQECEYIESRLRKIQNEFCFCCSCNKVVGVDDDNNKSEAILSNLDRYQFKSSCGGCTRRRCFHENKIEVVAVAVHQEEIERESFETERKMLEEYFKLKPKLGVVTIDFDEERYYPRWIGDYSKNHCVREERSNDQVLLYNSSQNFLLDADSCIYRHLSFGIASFFTQKFLNLLTHAGIIWEAIIPQLLITKENLNICRSDVAPSPLPNEVVQCTEDDASQSDIATYDRGLKNAIPVRSFFHASVNTAYRYHNGGRSRKVFSQSLVALRIFFKWKSCLNLERIERKNECVICKRDLLCLSESNHDSFVRTYQFYDSEIRSAFNALIGFIVSIFLATLLIRGSGFTAIQMFVQYQNRYVNRGLFWLENFPIGFKLNERITSILGTMIRIVWKTHTLLILRIVDFGSRVVFFRYAIATILVSIGMTFGGTCLLGLLLDITTVLLFPGLLFNSVFQIIYSYEIHYLAASWRLFRGKKRNILRERDDTMQYDSMQLLVGTILFAIELFLLTTIAMYHIFFKFFSFATSLSSIACTIPLNCLNSYPFGEWFLRNARRRWFCEKVYVIEVSNEAHRQTILRQHIQPPSQYLFVFLKTLIFSKS